MQPCIRLIVLQRAPENQPQKQDAILSDVWTIRLKAQCAASMVYAILCMGSGSSTVREAKLAIASLGDLPGDCAVSTRQDRNSRARG